MKKIITYGIILIVVTILYLAGWLIIGLMGTK